MDARRSRPARSSTSLFDQLGDTSSTGTLQASSAQRILRRAAALLEKMGCCSRGPWSAFPWSWRPPRSSTGKTKVVGLVELSMPAPLHHAHHDGITSYYLALCDPPTGGPTYCRPLSGCRLPEIWLSSPRTRRPRPTVTPRCKPRRPIPTPRQQQLLLAPLVSTRLSSLLVARPRSAQRQ